MTPADIEYFVQFEQPTGLYSNNIPLVGIFDRDIALREAKRMFQEHKNLGQGTRSARLLHIIHEEDLIDG